MTMAEKQYKNYDERFLKEDTSSGSRPVIEYDATNSSEIIYKSNEQNYIFKGKFLDGSYCQNANDLKKLFLSGAVFSYIVPESEEFTIYSPIMFTYNSVTASIISTFGGAILQVVDAPTFEQAKQSQS